MCNIQIFIELSHQIYKNEIIYVIQYLVLIYMRFFMHIKLKRTCKNAKTFIINQNRCMCRTYSISLLLLLFMVLTRDILKNTESLGL